MVLPVVRSFESASTSISIYSRSAMGGNGESNSASIKKFGMTLIMCCFLVFASVISPLREWHWLEAEHNRQTASVASSHGFPFDVRVDLPVNSARTSRQNSAKMIDVSAALQTEIALRKGSDSSTSPPRDSTQISDRSQKIPHYNDTVASPLVLRTTLRATSPNIDDTATSLNNNMPQKWNFSGVLARAYAAWPSSVQLPCFPAEPRWMDMDTQFSPAAEGLFYLKPYKTGSSTTSGVHLRIARSVARRQRKLNDDNVTKDNNIDICRTRFDHGPDYYPGFSLFRNRKPSDSFLWTVLRDPTTRATSQFFHFEVSRQKKEPTDRNFKDFLKQKHPVQDYYFRALYGRAKFTRDEYDPIVAANYIMRNYNFIGITERLDESLVTLMMQLNLRIGDILYLSAKGRGGYDDAGGPSGQCTYIWPSFISPGMKEYFGSDEWKDTIKYDTLLYQAVNRSLDMTIDNLGREDFNANLAKFNAAKQEAMRRCLPTTVFPCDVAGRFHPEKETDCIWKDSGCGTQCLDHLATELDLW